MIRVIARRSVCLAVLLGACTLTPQVPVPVLPAPAIEPLRARVAVVYGAEFRGYEHSGAAIRTPDGATLEGTGDVRFHYRLGANNAALFDQIGSALFSEVTRFDSWESLRASGRSFDATLEPVVAGFDAWQVDNGGYRMQGVVVEMAFDIRMYDGSGQRFLDWTVESQQRFCVGLVVSCGPHTKEAVVSAAYRDIAAKILVHLPALPQVSTWLRALD